MARVWDNVVRFGWRGSVRRDRWQDAFGEDGWGLVLGQVQLVGECVGDEGQPRQRL